MGVSVSQAEEQLQVRVYGDSTLPTLIYLPGLHGDWTLVGGFRRAVAGRVRFVEMTYPRTLTWSLEEYAGAVEQALAAQGITGGWLLGESFGSQVLWVMVARRRLNIEGLILAGGFVRHPMRWGVRLAEKLTGGLSHSLLTSVLFGWAKVGRFRFRHSPEVLRGLDEFLARRTELDFQAAKHRLQLITENNLCSVAQGAPVPVYVVTGLFDPIVPWYWVRRWLKKNCTQLREYKIIRQSDHTVLATAPQAAAQQILGWMGA